MDPANPQANEEDRANKSGDGKPPIALVQSPSNKNQEGLTPNENETDTKRKQSRQIVNTLWHYLSKPTLTDWLITIATVVIAIATWLTWREVHQGSIQTDKIVSASEKIQTALELSNAQNQNALTQTLAQSQQAMDASNRQSKAALDTTIRNSRLDERPWVGLKDFRCDDCTAEVDKPAVNSSQVPTSSETVMIGNMYGIMENSGKTPAVKMIVKAVWTDRKAGDPIPDYDSIERELQSRNPYRIPPGLPPDIASEIARDMDITKRFVEPPEVVLPPNANRTLPIMGRAKMGRDKFVRLEDRKIFYVIGKITYRSTWKDREHTTEFCLMDQYSSIFQFCPSGNSMN